MRYFTLACCVVFMAALTFSPTSFAKKDPKK